MNKGKIATFLALCLSLIVVIGGWFTIREMLNRKENTLLNQKGVLYELSSGIATQEKESGEQSANEKFEGRSLSETEMELVLEAESGGLEVPHEPNGEQMTMDQAIFAGQEWINQITEQEILPPFLKGCTFDKINAKLCTIDKEVSFDDALLSWWQITYVKEDVKIDVKIHAASGQIWKADISMNQVNMVYGACTEEEMVSIAFPFMEESKEEIFSEKHIIYKRFAGNRIRAAVKRDEIIVKNEEPISRLTFWLESM